MYLEKGDEMEVCVVLILIFLCTYITYLYSSRMKAGEHVERGKKRRQQRQNWEGL